MYDFSENEVLRNVRTKFKCPHNHKTTGNTGDLIPIYAKEILPGDYIKLDVKSLIKMTTPNFQTMDIAFADIAFYFVPRRLVWDHWKEFQGEKSVGPHEDQPEYTIPKTTAPTGGWGENTIADYLGIPTKVENVVVDSGYFRTYCLIWNEWYRDQNRQDFTHFTKDDANTDGSNGDNYVTDPIGGGKCLKVAKIHDYFTSTLLTPAGREQVMLPLGTKAPVIPWQASSGDPNYRATPSFNLIQEGTSDNPVTVESNEFLRVRGTNDVGTDRANDVFIGGNLIAPQSIVVWNNPGLQVDLRNATAATVNQLRLAFQLQKIFEANNRSGTRYIEILKNRWDVTPSDARLQRPEYLGGKRIPLNISMVVQTSSTDSESPLGQISGFSNTYDESAYFSKGFEEHGILMGFVYVRHQRTYQQGLHKMFTRTNMEDFYMPEFQNIGEQPVYNYEIFFSGDQEKDNQVFGYQEYAAEYRYEQNRVTGQFRSNATKSFDNWHYADDYADTPVNGEEWIVENPDAVDRTLTLTSKTVNQFYFDFYFDEVNVRTMPPHSIPGFIDHH